VKLLFLLVETVAKLFKEKRVVLLVLGAEMIAGAYQAGVLPVDVESVEVITIDELNDALDEEISTRFGEGHVGKIARPQPSSDGDEHCERGIFLPQGNECREVPVVVGEAVDDTAALQVGEGIVDARELLCSDLAGLNQIVSLKDIGDYDGLWSLRGCAGEQKGTAG
jgi:hypothetical protein